MAASSYEDALDIAEKNPAAALLMLNQAVVAMLHYWYRNNGHFIPRSKELLSLDEKLGLGAQQFFIVPQHEPREDHRYGNDFRGSAQSAGIHGQRKGPCAEQEERRWEQLVWRQAW